MIFWGVEVKSGQHVVVQPGSETLLHLSQACLGGIKKDKGSESVRLYAKKNGQKFLLGILSPEKFPHLNFDVVFEDDFELYHDGKNESVHFAGYKAQNPDITNEEEIKSDDSDGELVPMKALDNGTSQTKKDKPAAKKTSAPSKPEAAAGKAKVKILEPNKDDKQSEGSDSDEDSSDSDDSGDSHDSDSDSDEDVDGGSSDGSSDDSSDEDDESDEETPKKPETSKKRTAEASTKTPGPDKKAKFVTPVKNDGGKKPVPHVATPYPSKQVGRLPANNDKSKQQTPKSSGSFACNSCSRSFGSEQALQSHSKAKHAAK